jgi:aminobenzoyl-glutamate utilization protein B
MMTDTTVSRRIVGAAYPRHFNKPIAEAMYDNMRAVGMPEWSEDDQRFARAFQEFMGEEEIKGLETEVSELGVPLEEPKSGGSDDIGDVSWNVPTVTLRFPSNIDGSTFHHWSSSIAMATPIAHKGATAGAKVVAATMLDLVQDEALVENAWNYFREEQTANETYVPFIAESDDPAIEKNREIMEQYREQQRDYYYDPSKYETYLEQLGIDYPQIPATSAE